MHSINLLLYNCWHIPNMRRSRHSSSRQEMNSHDKLEYTNPIIITIRSLIKYSRKSQRERPTRKSSSNTPPMLNAIHTRNGRLRQPARVARHATLSTTSAFLQTAQNLTRVTLNLMFVRLEP